MTLVSAVGIKSDSFVAF